MKKVLKILILVLVTVLFWCGVKIIDITLDKHFVKSSEAYYTPLEYSIEDSGWVNSINMDSQTECICLNLLTVLKNGDYDEFKESFVYNYENNFNRDNCFLIIRRVFVSNSNLTHEETKILLQALDLVLAQDEKTKNTTAVYRNYMLQQEILYRDGRVIQAYKLDDVIQKYQ